MKLIVDECLSWRIADGLRRSGYDAFHVREIGLAGKTDEEIIARAKVERATVITEDSDFGTLLAFSGDNAPSVVRIEQNAISRPGRQLLTLLAVLPEVDDALRDGSVVVIDGPRVRITSLPIRRTLR